MGAFRSQPFLDAAAMADDVEALRRTADENGYLYFPGLVDPNAIWSMRGMVTKVCQDLGWLAVGSRPQEGIVRPGLRVGDYEDPDYITLQGQILSLPEYTELGRHPAIIGVLEKLYDGPVATDRGSVCRVFAPGRPELTTKPHQEYFYVRGTTDLWIAWLPLGDCPLELGGLALLPGSNHQGLLEHTGEGVAKYVAKIPEEATWATGDLECGDVLMFNCLTVHQAGDNQTADRLRISADFRYQPQTA